MNVASRNEPDTSSTDRVRGPDGVDYPNEIIFHEVVGPEQGGKPTLARLDEFLKNAEVH